MARISNSEILTQVKGVKGQSEITNQWVKAANDLYSRAVSRVRQPIESLFNWIIGKQIFKEHLKCDPQKDYSCMFLGKSQQLSFSLFLTLNSHT